MYFFIKMYFSYRNISRTIGPILIIFLVNSAFNVVVHLIIIIIIFI